MFLFDKDMERVMLAKKKEVLNEIEDAKKRVLHELYCIKESVHTDLCAMLADYNRIQFELQKLSDDLKKQMEDTSNNLTLIVAARLDDLKELEQGFNEALLELESLKSQVDGLIVTWEQIAQNALTQEDLEALRTELVEMINNIDVSEELEQLATELRAEIATAGVPGDWDEIDENSSAYIKNKPFYMVGEETEPVGGSSSQFGTNEYGASIAVNSFDPNTPRLYKIRAYTMSGASKGSLFWESDVMKPSYEDGKMTLPTVTFTHPTTKEELSVRSTQANGSSRISMIYYTAKATKIYLEVIVYNVTYVTCKPEYLANNMYFHAVLQVTADGKTNWNRYLTIESPNGSLFELHVSDDGTLSAVPVTT